MQDKEFRKLLNLRSGFISSLRVHAGARVPINWQDVRRVPRLRDRHESCSLWWADVPTNMQWQTVAAVKERTNGSCTADDFRRRNFQTLPVSDHSHRPWYN